MSESKLLRFGSYADILAGVLFPLALLVHPWREDTATILSQTWRLIAGHWIILITFTLILLGLPALYVRELKNAGRLGLAGFLLSFLGTVFFIDSSNYGFIAPVLARRMPALLNEVNLYGPEELLNILMATSFLLGFILFGIATAKAHVLPRQGGILLAIGAPLFLIGAAAAYPIGIIGGAVLGLGLIWLGTWGINTALVEQPG